MIYYQIKYSLSEPVKNALSASDMQDVAGLMCAYNKKTQDVLASKFDINRQYAEKDEKHTYVDSWGNIIKKYEFYSVTNVVNKDINVSLAFRNRDKNNNIIARIEKSLNSFLGIKITKRHTEEIATSVFLGNLKWGKKYKYLPKNTYTKDICNFISFAEYPYVNDWRKFNARNELCKHENNDVSYKKSEAQKECELYNFDSSMKYAIDHIYLRKKKSNTNSNKHNVFFVNALNVKSGSRIYKVLHKANVEKKYIHSNNINEVFFNTRFDNKEFMKIITYNFKKCEGSTVVVNLTHVSRIIEKENLEPELYNHLAEYILTALAKYGKIINFVVIDNRKFPIFMKYVYSKACSLNKFNTYHITDNNNKDKLLFEKYNEKCNKLLNEMRDKISESPEMLSDREKHLKKALDNLNAMQNMKGLKETINNMIADYKIMELRKKYQNFSKNKNFNIFIKGEAGTGKTTIIPFLIDILYGIGYGNIPSYSILRKQDVICNGKVGEIENFIKDYLSDYKKNFLVIEDFHEITSENYVPLDTLNTIFSEVKRKDKNLSVLCVGRTKECDKFFEINSGMKSNFDLIVDIGSLEPDELLHIAKKTLEEKNFIISEEVEKRLLKIFNCYCLESNFTSGHFILELISQATAKQGLRLTTEFDKTRPKVKSYFDINDIDKKIKLLEPEDFNVQICKDFFSKDLDINAREKLNNMIGLENVKKLLNSIVCEHKVSQYKAKYFNNVTSNTIHMAFYGNPGSAKTTIARILARLLKEEEILRTGKFVEVDRSKLVEKYCGHTAKNVSELFSKAAGGVLFVDEAYALCNSNNDSFGHEALDVLVKEMEDHRDDVLVILAGYPDKMNEFMEKNEGLKSRIAHHVYFDNYGVDDLLKILTIMAKERNLKLEKGFINKSKKAFTKAVEYKHFSNGRFARNIIDQAIKRQSIRIKPELEKESNKTKIKKLLTTIKEVDFNDDVMNEYAKQNNKQIEECYLAGF